MPAVPAEDARMMTMIPLPPPPGPQALIEYGRWIAEAAAEAGMDPEEFARRAIMSAETADRLDLLLGGGFAAAYGRPAGRA